MEKIFKSLKGVVIYFDDILVFGETTAEHNENLAKVLNKLEEHGFTISFKKCFFAQDKVNFLGFQVDRAGLHMVSEKVRSITQIRKPTNVTELKSFLGIVNYYAKFIRNYSTLASPLFTLLKKDMEYIWSAECDEAFQQIKAALISHNVLTHFNSELPLKVSCDASPTGLGAVLSHIFPNGQERPITFTSRSLT